MTKQTSSAQQKSEVNQSRDFTFPFSAAYSGDVRLRLANGTLLNVNSAILRDSSEYFTGLLRFDEHASEPKEYAVSKICSDDAVFVRILLIMHTRTETDLKVSDENAFVYLEAGFYLRLDVGFDWVAAVLARIEKKQGVFTRIYNSFSNILLDEQHMLEVFKSAFVAPATAAGALVVTGAVGSTKYSGKCVLVQQMRSMYPPLRLYDLRHRPCHSANMAGHHLHSRVSL